MEGLVLALSGRLTHVLLVTLLVSVPSLSFSGLPSSEVRSPHAPILIDGDAGFTASNGVVSGAGTPSDPYVIRGWEINASTGSGIVIRNTSAPFVLQDVRLYSGNWAFIRPIGVDLQNVSNARLEGLEVNNTLFGLWLEGGSDVRVNSSRFTGCTGGIVLQSTSRVSIEENFLSDNGWGAAAFDSSNLTIARNYVSANRQGLVVGGNATEVLVADNEVVGGITGIQIGSGLFNGFSMTSVSVIRNRITGVDGAGVHLASAVNVTLQGNEMMYAAVRVEGYRLENYNSHTMTVDNLVNGRPLRFYKDCSGITITDVAVGQLLVVNCEGVQIGRLEIDRADPGILMAFVEGASVLHATLSGGGIDIVESLNVTVSRSSVAGAWAGVFALDVDRLTLGGNVLEENNAGVYLLFLRNVTISGNVIAGNNAGIHLESADDATFVANVISGNAVGLYAPFPVGFQAFENSFVDNTVQVFESPQVAYDYDGGYPTGGNFWSDYSAPDLCSGPDQDVCDSGDGFGDIPYEVDQNSRDRYPRMSPMVELNRHPQASAFIDPPQAGVSTLFTVDATSSSDPEDPTEVLEVRWDWEDDGIWDTPWSTDKVAHHRYNAPGTYTIRVEVRDSGLLRGNATLTVTVTSEGPGLEIWIPVVVGTGVVASGFAIAFVYFRRRRPGSGVSSGGDDSNPPGPR